MSSVLSRASKPRTTQDLLSDMIAVEEAQMIAYSISHAISADAVQKVYENLEELDRLHESAIDCVEFLVQCITYKYTQRYDHGEVKYRVENTEANGCAASASSSSPSLRHASSGSCRLEAEPLPLPIDRWARGVVHRK